MTNRLDYSNKTLQSQIEELRNRWQVSQRAYDAYRVSQNAAYRFIYFLRISENVPTSKIASLLGLSRNRINQILLIVRKEMKGVKHN